MTSVNRENMSTAFTVSVDAAHDITTGISAAERALTIRTLADPKATVNDFVQPGHTFPLRAVPAGCCAAPAIRKPPSTSCAWRPSSLPASAVKS